IPGKPGRNFVRRWRIAPAHFTSMTRGSPARESTVMSRPKIRPRHLARDRVRRRPVCDALEGRFSAGSLLAWPVVGGMNLPSLQVTGFIGEHQSMGMAQAQERVSAVPAPPQLATAAAAARSRAIVAIPFAGARTPIRQQLPFASAAPTDDGV